MKKLIILLLLIAPLYCLSKDRVKGVWSDTRTHKTIKYQPKKEKQYKPHKTAKSIKRLQRKWNTFKN